MKDHWQALSESPKQLHRWARRVFEDVHFSDLRLRKRAANVLSALLDIPGEPYSAVFEEQAALKGFYRFVYNERVAAATLGEALWRDSARRGKACATMLVPAETTTIGLNHLFQNQDLGPTNRNPKTKGLFVHTALALTPQGAVRGIVDQQVWTRDPAAWGKNLTRAALPIEDYETVRSSEGT